ncbi:neurexin-4-like isoform X1 [Sergentomyia squamirostris]
MRYEMKVFVYIFLLFGSFLLEDCAAEYYENDYYSEYECNLPLMEQAALSATSSLRERGPNNARLDGKSGVHHHPIGKCMSISAINHP